MKKRQFRKWLPIAPLQGSTLRVNQHNTSIARTLRSVPRMHSNSYTPPSHSLPSLTAAWPRKLTPTQTPLPTHTPRSARIRRSLRSLTSLLTITHLIQCLLLLLNLFSGWSFPPALIVYEVS